VHTFKRSRDPSSADKLTDVVGLCVDPPAHAVVLSIDEKRQIPALDRTQLGLPLQPGSCETMTHDYKQHGTTTLCAALSVLDGPVIGRCKQRPPPCRIHPFLNTLERQVAADKPIHVVLDNYATHKHPKVLAWLFASPALNLSLHPDLGFLAQCGREFLLQDDVDSAPAAASSARSAICMPPLMLILPSTTPIPNPSSGPNPPKPSWPNSTAALYPSV